MLSTSSLQASGSCGGLYGVGDLEERYRDVAGVSDSVSESLKEMSSEWESRAIPEPGVGPSSMEECVEGFLVAVVEGERRTEEEVESREVWEVERLGGRPWSATCHTMM